MSGYTLKLDLTQHEHDVLVNVLKRESYNPAVKAILHQVTGYDEAVAKVKPYERHNQILRAAAKGIELRPNLLDPECTFGYTDEQVTRIMGARLYDFRKWMQNLSMTVCDGEEGCGPHGGVTFRQDVERFLLGFPMVD